jgi:hypothetical protein
MVHACSCRGASAMDSMMGLPRHLTASLKLISNQAHSLLWTDQSNGVRSLSAYRRCWCWMRRTCCCRTATRRTCRPSRPRWAQHLDSGERATPRIQELLSCRHVRSRECVLTPCCYHKLRPNHRRQLLPCSTSTVWADLLAHTARSLACAQVPRSSQCLLMSATTSADLERLQALVTPRCASIHQCHQPWLCCCVFRGCCVRHTAVPAICGADAANLAELWHYN